eukprot:1161880-Pelagomonas_calceolata.AAC.2
MLSVSGSRSAQNPALGCAFLSLKISSCARYEGGEIVVRWFMQGEGFMDEVQVLIEYNFLVFHEVELTRVDTDQFAGTDASSSIPELDNSPISLDMLFPVFFLKFNHSNHYHFIKYHVHQKLMKIGGFQITLLASDHSTLAHSSTRGPFSTPEFFFGLAGQMWADRCQKVGFMPQLIKQGPPDPDL